MNLDLKYNLKMRKKFVNANLKTIKLWTEEMTKKAAIYGLSDELSVAIMAFNEALDRYNGKGEFMDFARSAVRRRVGDYLIERTKNKSVLRKDFS